MSSRSGGVAVCLVALSACTGGSQASDAGPRGDGDAAADAVDGGSDGDGGAMTIFPAATKNGTRLRARTWVTEDGTRRRDVSNTGSPFWSDNQLGVPCTFQSLPSGEFACFPVATFGDPAVSFLPVQGFADAACTQRIAFGPGTASGSAAQASRDAYCVGKAYAFAIELQSGTATSPLYATGQPLALTTWYQRQLGTDNCVATPTPTGVKVVPLGQKVSTADLVVGHVERVPTGHRLSYLQIVADDGTRERIGWYDTVTNLECTVTPLKQGPARCVPAAEKAFLFPGGFGDAACTKALVYIADETMVPSIVQPDSSSLQAAQDSYYRVGGPSPDTYQMQDGKCVKTDTPANFFHFAEEIPLTTFDAFTDIDLSPTGARLGVAARADGEGAIDLAPATIMDGTTMAACNLAPASDGKMRCLPETLQKRYSNATCDSAPFVSNYGPTSPRYASGWMGDFCTGGVGLFEIGAAISTPADVYDTDAQGQGCARNPFASGSRDLTFSAVGDTVSPSTFAEAKLVVE
jgi:hypothetical protein